MRKLLLILLFIPWVSVAQIPDSDTFTLDTVRTVIGLSSTASLRQCFQSADTVLFDPTYNNSIYAPDSSLLRFRNYGNCFTFKINISAETITLPINNSGSEYDFIVYWGDGTSGLVTSFNDIDATHTYNIPGLYTIKFSGICEFFRTGTSAITTKITEVINWGNNNFDYLQFHGCTNLISLPSSHYPSSVITLTQVFYGCTSLSSIPSGLFDTCSHIESIQGAFANCTSLSSIPSGLFDNCTSVLYFNGVFYGCTSLSSIPSGLFDNCTSVTYFTSSFEGCTSLTGNAPELWTRIPEPTGTLCFYGATGLSNYSSIPSNWK